jgi:hypothetical protein
MIGGPADGQIYDVAPPVTGTINAQAPPRMRPSAPVEEAIEWPPLLRYHRQQVAVFGVLIPIYVMEGWPDERAEATLSTLLLSELALSLAEES